MICKVNVTYNYVLCSPVRNSTDNESFSERI